MAEIVTTTAALESSEAHPRVPEAEAEKDEKDMRAGDDDAGDSLKRKAEEQSPNGDGERTPKRARADSRDTHPRNGGGVDPSDRRRRSGPESPPVEESRSDARRPSASEADRQRGLSTEEKKRGKRLFGGLLNTLSQTTGKSQQKKRLEIERRQQDRAHQQKMEDDKRRAEKLAKLDDTRRIEQIRLEEEVMHRRHSQLLDRARCLRTRSAPRIYYRPWDPTEEEGRIIRDQIQDAEDQIDGEVQDFKRRREKRLRDLGVSPQPAHADSTTGEPPRERSNVSQVESSHRQVAKVVHEKDHEERDDMVETEEDTVIY